jgi:Tfp pilus assembly protein PilO
MSVDSRKIASAIKKRPMLLGASLAVLVVLGVIYVRYNELELHKSRLAELQGSLSKLQKNVANSAQLDRQLEEIKKINEKVVSSALRPSELARNLQYFYTLEADNGVKLLDLQQQAVPAPPRGTAASVYAALTFTVNVAGEYEQVLKFMREVEKTFIGGKVLTATISTGSARSGQDPEKARLLSMVVQTVATTK